ncbi:hypothetical protein Zmor_021688 [Zophobas morio]|uniref:Sulfotransferase domain-containing protein n=1 Tax=Zophobas morio TaxID=2755281 RepID=A0AA38I6M7_9CUCU|nr:hypothetical protein Zmor_021688 [Zophobas morio]
MHLCPLSERRKRGDQIITYQALSNSLSPIYFQSSCRKAQKNLRLFTWHEIQETFVFMSYYHHSKLLKGFKGTCEEFCELFLAGKVPYGPSWQYVLPFWEIRNSPNILYN